MDNENANRFWIPVWFCPLTERLFSPVVPPTLTPYPDHFIHPLENYPFHRTTQSPPWLCKHVVLTLEVILVHAQVHHSLLYMPPRTMPPPSLAPILPMNLPSMVPFTFNPFRGTVHILIQSIPEDQSTDMGSSHSNSLINLAEDLPKVVSQIAPTLDQMETPAVFLN